MDCLLLHIPKFSSVYLPLGEFLNITYMPMGLPALANQLQRNGYQAEIVHFGVEWIRDPEAELVEDAAMTDAPMIGAALYWHYQTFDVLDVTRRIREQRPDVFIFLGGITAGYFGTSLLDAYPHIDAVIQGDGEIAVVELAEAVSGKREFADVANLIWRSPDGQVVENSRRVASDQETIDSLDFGDLTLLRNRDIYVDRFGFPLAYPKQFSHRENDETQKMDKRSFFPLFTGRGCAWKCSFCGGNRDTLRRVTSTPTLRFRNYRRVVDDVEKAMDHGYRTMALCFDPTPDRDDYYVAMFQEIRRRKLDVDYYFECWGLPTDRFLDEWVKTFGQDNPYSYLALSPDAGNEDVRRLNKQPFYTDEAFYDAMNRLQDRGITTDVFFTIALPGETVHTARDTARMINRIRNDYSIYKRLMTWSVQLEPGSPQFENPDAHNMETDRTSIQDYFDAHGGGNADTYSTLGYKIHDYFGDERDNGTIRDFEAHIQSMKCMEFCFLGQDPTKPSNPAKGREWCRTRRSAIAESSGLDPEQPIIDETFRYADAAKALSRAFPAQRPRYK